MPTAARIRRVREALMAWAGESGRHFFWREPGHRPFDILVTEILLTKTRAELAEPVALELLARYPTPSSLANAKRADVARILFPLGLHRKRATQLVACAKALLAEHGGEVPDAVDDLMELPSVGRYAANAIASVSFGASVPVLDANVSRIYQRVFSLPEPPERLAVAHDLWKLAGRVLDKQRAKEFNWAILDLGGTVCTAKAPACPTCPLRRMCDSWKTRPSARTDATRMRAPGGG